MKIIIKIAIWCHHRLIISKRCLLLVAAVVFLLPTNQMAEGFQFSRKTSVNVFRSYNFKSWAIDNKIPVHKKDIPVNSKSQDLCVTEECMHTASAVLRKMKKEVKPCDDFYQFACGKYIDETQIPEDKVFVDPTSELEEKLNEQLKAIVAEKRKETEPKHYKLPNLLYKACMNTTLIEILGIQSIQNISEALGGWPVIVGSSWNTNNAWTWQETVKKFRRLGFGIGYILRFSVDIDLKNSTKRIIQLDQSSLSLSWAYLVKGFNDSIVWAYYDYMVDIAVLFGAKRESALKELKESLQFEIDLAKIFIYNMPNNNDLYNLRTIKELQESYPYVQWLDYINALLPEGLKADENEVINLSVPNFFDDLGKLLKRTNKRVIANYMMWRMHADSVKFLPEKFRNRKLQYETTLSGKKEEVDRWKECTSYTAFYTSYSVGSLYVRKHFQEESKAIALEMIGGLRAAFNQMLNKIDWMDQKTKQEAKRKLHAIVAHIGYADELLDNDKLEEMYRKLEIDPDNYFQSQLNMNVFVTDYVINRLRLAVNKTEWVSRQDPYVLNAFYLPLENSIQFPAGILQGHFFNAQRPQYMNYGAIGAVIGHELTHAFDDQGGQYDADGNLFDWWQNDTKDAFVKKIRCIIEQYDNFENKQTGLRLSGINTQGENIADNGGVKMAYKAYNHLLAKNDKEEPRLPVLNYTQKQMFWISFAQTLCAKYRTDPSKEYRVLGTLQNNKDFSTDFQCLEGTAMNPVHKCEVW